MIGDAARIIANMTTYRLPEPVAGSICDQFGVEHTYEFEAGDYPVESDLDVLIFERQLAPTGHAVLVDDAPKQKAPRGKGRGKPATEPVLDPEPSTAADSTSSDDATEEQ